ncbi:lycopene cyclase domain-containing protein [Halomarina ordinaria]|uniref:Lycopene cyclase domain-containing protein n=1 Tax=Halomarina ordinaria TaxID=3033939 RepID=A0ABD5U925_9EURY|nr:lycopene cyclase domain-containing protein [Halomarina sp. PSRA2]
MSLTYLEFHLLFVLPPIALLAATSERLSRTELSGLALMAAVAVVYTAPWDDYLVSLGVWRYGPGVVSARLGAVPVEEYLFFVLQPLLTGLWFHRVAPPLSGSPSRRGRTRLVGVACWIGVTLAGAALLTVPRGFYLGAILVWAAPVVAFQWAVGGPALWAHRRTVALAVGGPTLYLCTVDAVAISLGLWTISPASSTGLSILGLPVEEAVFFLLTNVLLVNGLLLFHWVLARLATGERSRRRLALAGRGVRWR